MRDEPPVQESTAPWAPMPSSPAARNVREWWQRAQHAYPPNTCRAWRCDWAVFVEYCSNAQANPLPAQPSTVANFVAHCRIAPKKPATVRRYLSTIALAHRVAKLGNPVVDELVQLELKAFHAIVAARQRQAHPLGWADIRIYLASAPANLRADRDRALLCVAYDTMARRSELVALNLEDLEFLPDGTGRALIRRSKTDQAGEGHQAYLSRQTVRYILRWLGAAELKEGALFRRLLGRYDVRERLHVDSVAETYKRVAEAIGMPSEQLDGVSGHSIRVGATQDLLALNINLASVMQSGRWKSARMPMRYGEHVLAARAGMARAAEIQGRD